MKDVVVVGSINVDLSVQLDHWPSVGETVRARGFAQALGGKGANQCIAAARLGATATMIGAVGKDELGRFALQSLSSFGVHHRVSLESDVPTGMALIDVVPSGDNVIRLVEGANGMLCAAGIRQSADVIGAAKVLMLQNETPLDAAVAAALIARQGGATVMMDPAPAPSSPWSDEVLGLFDVLTPNATEAGLFLGSEPRTLSEGEDAARSLSAQFGVSVIVTLGASGVAWAIGGKSGHCPAVAVEAQDTVAAGDCFNGAIAAELSRDIDLQKAIPFAVAAAALSTTRVGAAASLPSLDQVRAFESDRC